MLAARLLSQVPDPWVVGLGSDSCPHKASSPSLPLRLSAAARPGLAQPKSKSITGSPTLAWVACALLNRARASWSSRCGASGAGSGWNGAGWPLACPFRGITAWIGLGLFLFPEMPGQHQTWIGSSCCTSPSSLVVHVLVKPGGSVVQYSRMLTPFFPLIFLSLNTHFRDYH